VHWAITHRWRHYLADRELQQESLRGSLLPDSEANRSLTNFVDDLWSTVEATIPAVVIATAIDSARPANLDALFALEDGRRSLGSPPVTPERLAIATASQFERAVPFQRASTDVNRSRPSVRSLVDEFVARSRETAPHDELEAERIRKALLTFTGGGDLGNLRTPALIARRLRTWEDDEEKDGVPAAMRRRKLVWIRAYVGFLHERGYVAGWPGRQVRAGEALRRSVAYLRRTLVAVPVLGTLAYVGLFVGLSMIRVAPARHFPAWLALADAVTAGGLGQAGALTAPVAASLSIGVLLTTLLGHRGYERSRPLMVAVPSIAFVGLTLWFYASSDWTDLAVPAAVVGSGAFLALTLLALSAIELSSGIRLIALWIAYGTSLALVSALAPFMSTGVVRADLVVGGAALALAVVRQTNRARVHVVALRRDRSQPVDPVPSARTIAGAVTLWTHVFSAAVAYGVGQLVAIGIGVGLGRPLGNTDTATVVVVCFAVVLTAAITLQIRRRCRFTTVEASLNAWVQVISSQLHRQGLRSTLRRASLRLILIEAGSQLAVLAAAAWLLRGVRVDGSDVAVAFLLVVAATIAAEHLRVFALSVWELVVGRGPVSSAFVELIPEPERVHQSRRRRVWTWVLRLGPLFGLLLGLFSKLLDVAQVIQFLQGLIHL
jgi:hypothetical protein